MFQTHVSNTCFTLFVGLSNRWLRDFHSRFKSLRISEAPNTVSFFRTDHGTKLVQHPHCVVLCRIFHPRRPGFQATASSIPIVVEVKIDTAVPYRLFIFAHFGCGRASFHLPLSHFWHHGWDDRFAPSMDSCSYSTTTRDDSNKTGSTGSATSSS